MHHGNYFTSLRTAQGPNSPFHVGPAGIRKEPCDAFVHWSLWSRLEVTFCKAAAKLWCVSMKLSLFSPSSKWAS